MKNTFQLLANTGVSLKYCRWSIWLFSCIHSSQEM